MSVRTPQIFVSHSRYDKDIRKDFSEIFAVAGIMPKYMEFEKIFPPAWKKIKEQIKISEAVFLLLGPNIRNSYFTENWVAFEVGLACAFGKEVWVFEPLELKTDFPIPYVTDYMLYNLQESQCFDYIRGVMEAYKNPVPIFPLIGEGRDKRHIPYGELIKCPYTNCQLEFHLHTTIQSLCCPLCRQILSRC
jgi:hypothetical protein